MEKDIVYNIDCLKGLRTLDENSVDMCVTSPPYYALRDYGTGRWEGGDPNCPHYRTSKFSELTATGHKAMGEKGQAVGDAIYKSVCPLCGAVRVDEQIGLEETPEEYIDKLTEVFVEVYRVLKPEGTLWLNIGDSYWGGGWRNAAFNENSGEIQKHSKGTHCGETMPACKGKVGEYKPKDLIGIPWMLAFSLRRAGWYLRQDIIWHKPNPMPESVTDRCTKSHEYLFLLSKSQKYYYDNESIMEPVSDQQRLNYQSGSRKFGINADRNDNDMGERSKDWQPKMRYGSGSKTNRTHEQGYAGAGGHRDNSGGFDSEIKTKDGEFVRNKRDVWSVNVKPDTVAHFATYPEDLIKPCILAGCPREGIVLDPFMGSGTTARVARMLNRHFVGFELNPEYCKIINNKTQVMGDLFY
jgi:DNA modification methylase